MNSPSRKRIAFIGAGAIGGFVGGHLAKAGLDVGEEMDEITSSKADLTA